MKYIIIAQILNCFLLGAFAIDYHKISDKLGTVSVVLLAFVALLDASRGEIPEI